MCVFALHPLSFSSGKNKKWTVNSGCEIDRAEFRDWMSFLPCNFMEKVSRTPEAVSAKSFISIEKLRKQK